MPNNECNQIKQFLIVTVQMHLHLAQSFVQSFWSRSEHGIQMITGMGPDQ